MQELLDFVKQFPLRTYPKGEAILFPGESTESLFIISSGFAKVYTIDANGNEQLLWIAGRSDIAPTELLFHKSIPLQFFYSTMSDLTAYEVNKAQFLQFAEVTPLVMKEIAYGLSNHYDDLLLRLSSVTQSTAREKLIYALSNIAERFSIGDNINLFDIGLNITHQDIAGLMHASRETASIELKKLKDEKVIDYSRVKFIIHTDKLKTFL